MERSNASKILEVALYRATSMYPALINIFSVLKVVYTDKVPTMGVDKYARLVVNEEWLEQNQQYMQGLLLHETLHLFFNHHLIQEKHDYEPIRFNIAGDIHINSVIDDEGLALPDGCCRNTTFNLPENLCTEEYYHLLEKKMKSNDKMIAISFGGGDGKSGSGDMLNDEELQKELDKLSPDHLTSEELNEQVQETYHNLAEGKQAGSMTSHLADFAREQLKPKVNWQSILQNRVRTCETTVYKLRERDNYKRPSRKTCWGGGAILPKKSGKQLYTVLSFDTSASITPELLNQFLSEVKGALQYSEVKRCYLWNTKVYWSGTDKDLQENVETLYQTGGTEGDCMKQVGEDIKSDIYIHFTDGYLNYPTGMKGTHLAIVWEGDEIKEVRNIK